jgi:hypothetical protein
MAEGSGVEVAGGVSRHGLRSCSTSVERPLGWHDSLVGATGAGDGPIDRVLVRGLVVDANDGIIAVAGIGEGFVGAGASATAALLAVVAATVAGSIAVGGAKYNEAANERDAEKALIDEEARQLALSPDEELAELTALYVDKGLSPDLAAQVAVQLSRHNPLAAHADAEHGIDVRAIRSDRCSSQPARPWRSPLGRRW